MSGSSFVRNGADIPPESVNLSGGGAIDVDGSHDQAHPLVNIINSTFLSNTALQGGGAIDVSSEVTVTQSTFVGNISQIDGGALRVAGVTSSSLTIRNTILSENFVSHTISSAAGSDVYDVVSPGVLTPEGCNGAIIDGGGNVQWPASDSSCPGLHGDPKLGSMYAYGGPTPTIPISGLDSAAYRRATANCPEYDQRGYLRVRQGACDAGAYELAPARGWLPALAKSEP